MPVKGRSGNQRVDGKTHNRSPRGKLNEARWNEILGASADVFIEKGYEPATIREIASRVGMLNQGSLYYYIETKEDLLFALIERSYHRSVAALDEDEDTANAGATVRLLAFIERWITQVVLRDSLAVVVEREFHSLSNSRRRALRPLGDQCEAFLKGLIEQGIAEKRFDPDLNVAASVKNVLWLLNNTHRWLFPDASSFSAEIVKWNQTFITRGLSSSQIDADAV